MGFDDTWRSIRETLSSIDRDAVLVTPGDERVFAVEHVDATELRIRYRDDGERTLEHGEFTRLAERLDGEGLALDSLPPGVGPYVAVLTLAPSVTVDSGHVRWRTDAEAGEPDRPFLKSLWDVRRTPERIHDDSLLLAQLLERLDGAELAQLTEDELVDLYVLLSDVQRGSDDFRRDVSEDLIEYVGPGGRLHGTYGTVTRAHRKRRHLKDEDVVLDRLEETGVPEEWVLGVDRDKLDVVIATTEVEEEEVYDVEDSYYMQKTGVESEAKRSRLQGLKDRLDAIPDEEATVLLDEIESLEDRIDDVLAA